MRVGHLQLLTLLAVLVGAVGCTRDKVQVLGLRDARLSIEARRWLADAEDEVAIAGARVDDAQARLERQRSHGEALVGRLRQLQRDSATSEGTDLTRLFAELADQREALAVLHLRAARADLAYARARLTLTRAETAVRYDLAVYELDELVAEVDRLGEDVAAAERAVEDQQSQVDRTADAVWLAYTRFVDAGGATEVLWGAP